MTLDERLARLERANRRLWAACGAMGLACLLGAAQARPRDVTARSFLVADDKGRLVASLGSKGGLVGLHFYDARERTRVSIGMEEDGSPTVNLWGTAADPTRDALLIYVDAEGRPAIQLRKDGARKTIRATDP